ncbi:hypothetical protein JUN65_08260 [Gluconacetobacter azotocaptans]|uniref:hypothetical protein n=1 Tax=Gluconacetobacter azotocaptans TaxID=142834 RepID=UPI00195831D3|nr:hypothetical protein [Gluconacetobacter azotocaptans]MBM9401578.1 hypothetical protein [Gluconacetobacter azotocaptans]
MTDLPEPMTPSDCDMSDVPMPVELIRALCAEAGIDPDWAIQFCLENGMPIGGLN